MRKLVLTAIILISTYSYSQVNKRKAFQLFKEARNEYYDDNFKEAANLFEQTVHELGTTNIQIQPFYVLSLDKIEDWKNLELEVPKFFELPNHSLNEYYKEILEIQTKLKSRLNNEKGFYLEIKQKKSVLDYKSFLDKYPESKYAPEIKKLLDNLEEEILWERSLVKNSLFSMENYLESSKLKKYASEAENIISLWDKAAKAKAIHLDTQSSYNAYLTEFPKGEYTDIIREKLALKIEDDLFETVKKRNKGRGYRDYLDNYPNGRYTEEVNKLYEKLMIDQINNINDDNNFVNLRQVTQSYKQIFPNGENISRVNKLEKRAERNLNKRNSGMLLFSYETNESFGLQLGSLRKKKLGWYLTARATTNIMESTFQRDDVIPQSDFESMTTEYETVYGSASLGLTLPIVYPIYLHAGAGVNFKQYLTLETDLVDQMPFFVEEEETLEVFPEAGLVIKLGPVLFSGGASYIREEIIYKAGLGFTF